MSAGDHIIPIDHLLVHDIGGAGRRALKIVTRLLPTVVLLDSTGANVSKLLLAGGPGWVVLMLDGLLLVLLLLVLLGGEHVHARGGHEDRAQVAHVLWLTHHVLRYAKDDAIAHHLRSGVLLSGVPMRCHHLL